MILRCNRFLQRRAPKSDAHSLFPPCEPEKVIDRRGAQDAQQGGLTVEIIFDTRQRQLP